ncbi:coiled-coil domain-containing protein R3HCC1L isoform X2 [Phlebotomus papatasi]|uniref:coiled-coil domain-containing protein R3HCC1L isoform X2 n=1 Tax=Phlebotomus papatasi TaxID=29031 RepID=UPI00248455B8|nr:coiled-coil domain-containing protein R3HCC1L isoform X2 [Phlebotomus papatasi]
MCRDFFPRASIRVLIFPPVNNFRRFLIHKTCEELATLYNIATFSIGQGHERRTVVCSKSQLINRESLLESQSNLNCESVSGNKSKLEKDTLNARNHDWDAFRKKKPKSDTKSWRMGVESNRSNVPPLQRTRTTTSSTSTSNGGNVSGGGGGGGGGVELYRPPPLRKAMLQQTPSEEECGDKNTPEESIVAARRVSGHSKGATAGDRGSTGNQVPQKSDQSHTKNPDTSAIVNQNRSTIATPRQRERRPDRAVYIPRARRSQTTPPSTSSCANQPATISEPPLTNVSPSSKQLSQQSCNKSVISPQSPTETTISNISKENCDAIQQVGCSNPTNNTCSPASKEQSDKSDHEDNYLCDGERCVNDEEEINNPTATDCDSVPKTQKEEVIVNCVSDEIISETDAKQENTTITENNEVNMSRKSKVVMDKSGDKSQGGKKSLRIEDDLVNGSVVETKEDKEEREFRRASQEINRSNRRIIKQTFNSSVLEISDPQQKNEEKTNEDGESQKKRVIDPENDDWDTMFDDNGDCLDPNLLKELTTAVGKVKIDQPKTDYRLYQSKQDLLSEEEFPHVLEVSNFPVEFKTQDLIMIFSAYKESGFEIKWVDDTHALAVFSSSKIAAEILATSHPFVCLKPLAEATAESRSKAKKCSNSLQPYRARPETCAALARRLVTGALGVRLKTTREELENERRVLRAAKERKLLAAKQRDEVWDS